MISFSKDAICLSFLWTSLSKYLITKWLSEGFDDNKLTWDKEQQAYAMDIVLMSDEGLASLGEKENMAVGKEVCKAIAFLKL